MDCKITDYIVIVRDGLRSYGGSIGLENEVKDMIKTGWEPIGGCVASPNGWVQAMIKKETK